MRVFKKTIDYIETPDTSYRRQKREADNECKSMCQISTEKYKEKLCYIYISNERDVTVSRIYSGNSTVSGVSRPFSGVT
jgi:gamma-glutamylcyclotransferase (GGCT)/AIG2-like uncharacterized protein YtfP